MVPDGGRTASVAVVTMAFFGNLEFAELVIY